jgi:hypothetical protein
MKSRGNHRRTKSNHPDQLNKMVFSIAADPSVGGGGGGAIQD